MARSIVGAGKSVVPVLRSRISNSLKVTSFPDALLFAAGAVTSVFAAVLTGSPVTNSSRYFLRGCRVGIAQGSGKDPLSRRNRDGGPDAVTVLGRRRLDAQFQGVCGSPSALARQAPKPRRDFQCFDLTSFPAERRCRECSQWVKRSSSSSAGAVRRQTRRHIERGAVRGVVARSDSKRFRQWPRR